MSEFPGEETSYWECRTSPRGGAAAEATATCPRCGAPETLTSLEKALAIIEDAAQQITAEPWTEGEVIGIQGRALDAAADLLREAVEGWVADAPTPEPATGRAAGEER